MNTPISNNEPVGNCVRNFPDNINVQNMLSIHSLCLYVCKIFQSKGTVRVYGRLNDFNIRICNPLKMFPLKYRTHNTQIINPFLPYSVQAHQIRSKVTQLFKPSRTLLCVIETYDHQVLSFIVHAGYLYAFMS